LKWKKCLEIYGIYHSFYFLQKIACIGYFFNNFLPTTIGGDGYRILRTLPASGAKSRAIAAILLERIVGFAALLFMGFAASVFVMSNNESYILRLIAISGVFILTALLFIIVLLRVSCFPKKINSFKFFRKFEVIFENLQYIRISSSKFCSVVMVSFVFQILAVIGIYYLFQTFGLKVSLLNCAVIAALIAIAAILPVSINGIGVVEGAFVYAALQVNIAMDQAIIVALMYRILNLPFSITCGIIHLLDKRPDKNLSREAVKFSTIKLKLLLPFISPNK
jgi:uncharacterized protein (TIRG00374 family)